MPKQNRNPKRGKEKIKEQGSRRRKPEQQLRQNSFVKTVLDIFLNNPLYYYDYQQVAKALGINDQASKDLVKRILQDLATAGTLNSSGKERYMLNPDADQFQETSVKITGTVDMKRTGKAYLLPDDGSDDIYISASNTNHALDGDKAEVHLFPHRIGRKREGQVVKIIKRNRVAIVGVLQLSKKFAFVVPDDTSVPVDIFIPQSGINNAKDGEKVIARITDWPERSNNPFGEVIDILGMPGLNEVEMNSILASFDFPLRFPVEAEKEAERIPDALPQAEIARRRDFRDVTTLTIDPFDAKDFDDALSLRKLRNGNWEVGVHIADVSYYVKPGSALDKEAYLRATSVYLVDRTIPMLPEKLSNMVCSLRPDEDKFCFSAVFELNDEASVKSSWFGRTVIRSDRRFAYEEAQKIIEGEDGDLKPEIMTLHNLASVMRKQRFDKGAIAFQSQEVKFILDETGKPLDTYVKESKEANWLIEEFMLLANKLVAEHVGMPKGRSKPPTFVYRIHDTPNQEKLATFAEFVNKLGYKMNIGSRKGLANSFNALFQQISGKGEQHMIETIAIRTMAKAIYSTTNIGHYGLSFKHYTHFTSPIRRYPDLMVHRLLEQHLNSGIKALSSEYEEYCDHCSEMEKKAADAERASVKYKQAEYLIDKIGMEFEGVISGVSKWGIYVELEKSKCEGMIPITRLDDDYYTLDEENYRIIGRKFKKVYRLGDKITIIVKSIDLQKKQMTFDVRDKV
jgi:ribonuclease R